MRQHKQAKQTKRYILKIDHQGTLFIHSIITQSDEQLRQIENDDTTYGVYKTMKDAINRAIYLMKKEGRKLNEKTNDSSFDITFKRSV